jgi:hypothetical protein
MIVATATGWVDTLGGDGAERLIVGSAVISALLVIVRWITLPGKFSDRLGTVDWSFGDSWASTLTTVGALLGTILATATIPDDAQPLSGTALGGLNLLFGAIALMAPILFSAFLRAIPPEDAATEPSLQGYVGAFLGAALLTVWATLGELATVSILLRELPKGTLVSWASTVFLVIVLLSAILVAIYAWTSMRYVILFKAKGESAAIGTRSISRSAPKRWSLL